MSEIFNIIHLDNKGVKNKYIFSIDKFNNNNDNISKIYIMMIVYFKLKKKLLVK